MGQAVVCQECGTVVPGDAPEGLCPRCLMKHGLPNGIDSPVGSKLASTGGYGAPFAAPEPAALAPHFPQLEILELLGQGGMGAVYKARQLKLDRLVALKILPVESANAPAFAERFNREARALARLSHPHIVAVHDFGETGGLYYFIMEYVDGANLRQLLYARQLHPQDSLKIIPQICEALQFAHEEGIVHRDIKPENILLDKRGRVKIADFGLAKLLGTPTNFTLTGSRQMMGTPHYMAPEQMERPQQVDHRADIFSLGVVFYEMLTSELPLGRFAPPSQKAHTDSRLDDVVLRALAKEPELRYQHVSEIKSAVELLTRAAPPARPMPLTVKPEGAEPDLEMIRLQVQGPAGGLLLASMLALVSWTLVFVFGPSPGYRYRPLGDEYPGLIPLFVVPSLLMILGALKMVKFRGYELAIVASILAIAPWYPAWPIGFFIGVWALRALKRADVRAGFALTANPKSRAWEWVSGQLSAQARPAAPPPRRGILRSFMRSVRYYCVDSLLGDRSAPNDPNQIHHGP
jgi:predicted Ser/Thr protein kinase